MTGQPPPVEDSANRPQAFFRRHADRLAAAGLFLLVSSIYFATASGITSSNDGSHYALVRAMADEGRFEISTYAHMAEGNDLARVGERIYSDRPPGTALLTLPFYLASQVLPGNLAPVPSRHEADNPRLIYVVLTSVFAGSGAVVVLYMLLRGLEVGRFGALTASLVFAFGSLNWKYGSVLFSHAASAFTILLGVALLLRAKEKGESVSQAQAAGTNALLGAVLGTSVLVEYSNVIFVGVAVGYWAVRHGRAAFGRRGLALLGGLALPLAFLAYYNTVNFAGPLTTSYAYAVNYPWAAKFSTTFDFPLLAGLKAMLWYSEDARFEGNVIQGLFLLTPVAVFSFFGLRAAFRKSARQAGLVIGLFLLYLLLFSKHHTLHGYTRDGRYLAPFLGLWFVPLAFWLEASAARWASGVRGAATAFAFYLFAFLSVRNVFLHIGYSYNYRLDPTQFPRLSTPPAAWAYAFGQVFPNAGNLPLLWLVEALGVLGVLLAVLIARGILLARKPRSRAAAANPGIVDGRA